MTEDKLVGNIISREGVNIDPERVEAIQAISFSKQKKEIQSFLRKINFLRTFIPNFAKMIKFITNMLNKGSEVKWTKYAKASFIESRNHWERIMF
jgi:hypothetical protein